LLSNSEKCQGKERCLRGICDQARAEGFFSKFARSVLRQIRVTSKQELRQRIMAGIEDVNRYPVIHTLVLQTRRDRLVMIQTSETLT